MFSFVVKMPPQLSVLPRPSSSTKRSINMEPLIAAVKSHSRASDIIHVTPRGREWPFGYIERVGN